MELLWIIHKLKIYFLSHGLIKGNDSEGKYFQFIKGNYHRIIFERLRPLKKGGAGGYLYAAVLEDYKHMCSKHGHICLSKIESEYEFRDMLERVIAYFESNY